MIVVILRKIRGMVNSFLFVVAASPLDQAITCPETAKKEVLDPPDLPHRATLCPFETTHSLIRLTPLLVIPLPIKLNRMTS